MKKSPIPKKDLFAFTRPLERNIKFRNRKSENQFQRLMSLLENEVPRKSLIKNHKFDKKAFPAIYSKIEKIAAESGEKL